MKRTINVLLVLVVPIVLLSANAGAQPANDPEKLFSEGLALMGEEKFEDALHKLEEAEALDPGIGTRFNIALCYEKLGKLGTAWRNYSTVRQLAHASGKTAREENARLKLEELRPRLSVLVFRVAEPTGAVLKVDGVVVAPVEWASYPVDPGAHRIEAEATARKPWSGAVDAPAPGERLEVKVPVLVSASETTVVTVTKETTNGRRTLGFILGGVGVASLGAAVVTGVMILGDKAAADKACNPHCLNADGTLNQGVVDDVNQGKTLLPINLVAWGIAAAGIGVGTYLILTSTKKVSPMVGDHATGLVLSGTL